MRTNIEIDDQLMKEALRISGGQPREPWSRPVFVSWYKLTRRQESAGFAAK